MLIQFNNSGKKSEQINALNLRNKNKSENKQNYKYNKETYKSLPLLEKIIIKNKINKIILAYRIYTKRKNVSK